jgi:hypothetical protein
MLELMIGIFLVCLCALPFAQMPIKALKEETKSAYRTQMHRFADLTFAQIQEKLYGQEISWQEISSASDHPIVVIDDMITISLEPLGTSKFQRKVSLHSKGKKDQKGEEWRLVTLRVRFSPIEKNYHLFLNKTSSTVSRTFTYQILLNKAPV